MEHVCSHNVYFFNMLIFLYLVETYLWIKWKAYLRKKQHEKEEKKIKIWTLNLRRRNNFLKATFCFPYCVGRVTMANIMERFEFNSRLQPFLPLVCFLLFVYILVQAYKLLQLILAALECVGDHCSSLKFKLINRNGVLLC